MNKFLKKALCLFTALTMTLSFSACEGLLEDLGNAITSGLESVLDGTSNSNPSTGGGQNTGGSSTGGSVSTGGSSTGGDSTSTGGSVSTGGGSTGSSSSSSSGGGSVDPELPDDSSSGGNSSMGGTSTGGDSTSTGGSVSTGGGGSVDPELPDDKTARLDIHFLELGLYNTGDCTYIKAGDTDILIDAGAKRKSAPTITSYLSKYCTDGKLEYVIATHAHEDHIAGFVGESGKNQGVFDLYRVGTLIDFPQANSNSGIYNDYKTLRSSIISKYGTKHYTALEWWNGVDGLPRSIEIADGITMNVLYQKYYEKKDTSDENNHSVCVMFSQEDNHYLFTGDLHEPGEKSLVESNKLPKVKLYKAGHHGSKTSSCPELMKVIQPEVVCVCCCAGSNEYTSTNENQFPTQIFINNVAPYTDKIYVTSLAINDANGKTTGFTSMNGNLVVSSTGGALTVNCSNNTTILKETAWFKANRTWPANGV